MESIWCKTVQLPQFPPLKGNVSTDVLVIGGGMAGLLCAYKLKKAGVDCVVAERKRIASGVTGDTTAKLTSQHGLIYGKIAKKGGLEAAKLYLQANEEALSEYRALCAEIPCDFEEQSHTVYSRQNVAALEEELAVLSRLNYPAELVTDLPLPFPTDGGIRFPHQAQFHPLKFLSGIVDDLTIYENTAVQSLSKTEAVTEHGRIHANAVVVATHFPFLNKHGSYFLKLYQQRSYVLALEHAPIPEGMYLDVQENGLSFRSWDDLLLLGGCGHRTGKPGGGWAELEAFAREHYPNAKIVSRWATQDCMSLDGLPYIGQYSASTPNLYVATGFNKWGMTTSMAAAGILTNLVCGREPPYASLFSPSRSILHPQLGVNALESTVNLLTPSRKRCPHLGCALKWNAQEHSWDCPCHGSRFSEDGKLLDNPATGDLPEK
ncbi:MAG: FAD-dependent oxidoreductase [Clostridiales bacterium]|nr:FAD-dependent oxidoreductase [Clostridiales bacterium]